MTRPGRLMRENLSAFILLVTHDPLKRQPLHCRVEVEGEDHDPPPRGILSEVGRRKPSSGKVFFHDGMGFFALAAPLVKPVDQFTALHVPVRDDAEDLVALLLHGHGERGR